MTVGGAKKLWMTHRGCGELWGTLGKLRGTIYDCGKLGGILG